MNRKTDEKLDDAREMNTSPVPSIQSTHKKSRGEQANLLLASSPSTTSTTAAPQKRKKNWRSPSNPIDFMNCVIKGRTEHKLHKESNNMQKFPASYTNLTAAPCTQKGQQQQLNFNFPESKQNRPSGDLIESVKEMTIIRSSSAPSGTRKESKPLLPYETLLLREPSENSNRFVMLAELSVSPIVSTGSSDYTSTRRHVFAFQAAYCQADFSSDEPSSFDSTSLAHGHIDPLSSDEIYTSYPNIFTQPGTVIKRRKVTFSRCSLVQVILRNPEDNSVSGIFVVKLDLADMPADSRTILRQKVYKSKCLTDDEGHHESGKDKTSDYLAKFIEIPLKRVYDPEANRQKIILAGPIRVAFSFNRSNLRFTTPRRSDASAVEPVQKTRTVLQFPSIHQKYFPIHHNVPNDRVRSNSLNNDNTSRSFQHGSLCL